MKYIYRVFPLFLSLIVTFVFYPGMMSYDTLHALRSARNGVTDSMWPPMVSYVWRFVDLVSTNPSAMHFFQVAILMYSVFFIFKLLTKKANYSVLFLTMYLGIPVIFGTVVVIWKDVLMASFFLAGFVLMIYMKQIVKGYWLYLLGFVTLVLVFLGTCSRHNAITGAVPLLFYLAYVVCARFSMRALYLWLGVFAIGSVLTGGVFKAKTALDNFSLPHFETLANSSGTFIQVVQILDLAGASLCVGENQFGVLAPHLSIADIEKAYDPRHINLSKGLLDQVSTTEDVGKVWLTTAVNHPVCILNNKYLLTKFMVGANDGGQFIITHPSVDENEYGYALQKSDLRELGFRYIIGASQFSIFRPWFLYFITCILFVFILVKKTFIVEQIVLFFSGMFYLGGLILFGNAADARLLFYTTTVFFIVTCFSLFDFNRSK